MEYQSGAVRPIDSISEGWNLIKNDYWTYFLMMLVMGVIVIIAALILGTVNTAITRVLSGVLGIATSDSADVAKASAAILPQIIGQIIGYFVNLVVVTLSGVLVCGIYKSLSKLANNGIKADFSDLFSGFENVQSCFIYAAIISAIQFIIGVVMLFIAAAVGLSALGLGVAGLITKDGQLNPAIFGGLLLAIFAFVGVSIVINLIISALTAFVFPLIAERNLSGAQALSLSVKSGLANIGGLILLLILMFFMILGGVFACFIGVLFVAPILSAALFSAYRSVFGRVQTGYQNNPPPPPNFGQQPGY